jgi:hypothetical protein
VSGDVVTSLRHVLGLRPDEPLPLTLTVREAAKVARVSDHVAYDLCARDEWPVLRWGERPLLRIPTFPFLALLGCGDRVDAPSNGDPRPFLPFSGGRGLVREEQ